MGDGSKRTPLLSTRANDPDVQDSLDAFVVGLGERIDALQDAEIASDLPRMGVLAGELRDAAADHGYELLADCAAGVRTACASGNAEVAHKGLLELTEITQRVRLGHRGAA